MTRRKLPGDPPAEPPTPENEPDREATPEEQAQQDALMKGDFDPATEPAGERVLPPGVTRASELPGDAGMIGALEEERDRLRAQVAALQGELEHTDPLPEYENEKAGTGHLVERLARVTHAMSRLPKRGFNKEQSYAFVAHADVLDAVRPALSAEGVSFASTLIEYEAVPEGRSTKGGMPWNMWRVKIEVSFQCYWYPVEGQNGSPGAEVQKHSWLGFAQDYSDKGASKALTSAIKTFLIQQFLLSTGDDPDENAVHTDSVRDATPQARQAGAGQQQGASSDVRAGRNACLDINQRLPQGVLGKIAKKVANQGVIMKINDVGQLEKIRKAAERYVENPEGGEAWLRGDAPEQSEDARRQEASGEPDPADGSGRDALPPAPVTLPPVDSYDPPLTEEEKRQHALDVDPRPPAGDGEDF